MNDCDEQEILSTLSSALNELNIELSRKLDRSIERTRKDCSDGIARAILSSDEQLAKEWQALKDSECLQLNPRLNISSKPLPDFLESFRDTLIKRKTQTSQG